MIKFFIKVSDGLIVQLFAFEDYTRIYHDFLDGIEDREKQKGIWSLTKENLCNVKGLCLANIEVHKDTIAEYEEDIFAVYKCDNYLEEKLDTIGVIRRNIETRKDCIKLEEDVLNFIKLLSLMLSDVYFSFD